MLAKPLVQDLHLHFPKELPLDLQLQQWSKSPKKIRLSHSAACFFGPLHHDWKPPWTKTTQKFLYNTFVSATHPRPPTSAEYQAFSTGAADPQPETTQDEWLSAIILSSFGWCITWRFKKHFDKSGNFKSTLIYVITLRFQKHFDNWQLWKHFDVYVALWYFKSTLTTGNFKSTLMYMYPFDISKAFWHLATLRTQRTVYAGYMGNITVHPPQLVWCWVGKIFYKFFLNLASFCS